ncbi:MAG: hypothetical protein R2856_29190 [Caldilineaceae bacterium]
MGCSAQFKSADSVAQADVPWRDSAWLPSTSGSAGSARALPRTTWQESVLRPRGQAIRQAAIQVISRPPSSMAWRSASTSIGRWPASPR